jgi:hypothetical protein
MSIKPDIAITVFLSRPFWLWPKRHRLPGDRGYQALDFFCKWN